MIPKSSITEVARSYIQKKLMETAQKYNVRILFAVESGSRAWGFPSINSDYDVRFIYVRHKEDYLSVKPYRDVIETDLLDDSFLGVPLDLNGWDVRKALQLTVKSNAILIEWLQSPITYLTDDEAVIDLLRFAQESADLEALKLHYYKLAMNIWRQIEENADEVKLKLYCYALRPVLALQWICKFHTTAPMDMNSLMNKLVDDTNLIKEVSELITLKVKAEEGDIISRNHHIDSFIRSVLSEPYDVSRRLTSNEEFTNADKLFRKLVR